MALALSQGDVDSAELIDPVASARAAGLHYVSDLSPVVRLLEETRIRVGNDEYRKENGSFGLTTLRNRQVNVVGSEVRFSFRGKSGKHHLVELDDPRLARIIRRCLDIPGQELFKYVDE